MDTNQLLKDLALPKRGMIAIVGGGGKTTLMYTLAHTLANLGNKVIVGTSTHIFAPTKNDVDTVLLTEDYALIRKALRENSIVAVGHLEGVKLASPSLDFWDEAKKLADYVIVEADGSKRLPFKAPASHEPVIPNTTDIVIAVAGLSALGQQVKTCCHRPELVAKLINKSIDAILSESDMAILLSHPLGQLKGVSNLNSYRVLLNQADTPALIAKGMIVANQIRQTIDIPCLITSLHNIRKDVLIC